MLVNGCTIASLRSSFSAHDITRFLSGNKVFEFKQEHVVEITETLYIDRKLAHHCRWIDWPVEVLTLLSIIVSCRCDLFCNIVYFRTLFSCGLQELDVFFPKLNRCTNYSYFFIFVNLHHSQLIFYDGRNNIAGLCIITISRCSRPQSLIIHTSKSCK